MRGAIALRKEALIRLSAPSPILRTGEGPSTSSFSRADFGMGEGARRADEGSLAATSGKLVSLRHLITKPALAEAFTRVALGHDAADLCLKGGLITGALHEIFAVSGHEASATGFVAGLALRVAAKKHVLWIRQDFSALEFGELSPIGLHELGLDPNRLLLLSATNPEQALRAAGDALTCAALGAVIIELAGNPKLLDLKATRRLGLASAQKSVTCFLLRFAAEAGDSAAETRWRVKAAPSFPEGSGEPRFTAELLRNRHGQNGEWAFEWSTGDGKFKNNKAHCGAVVPTAVNGQGVAEKINHPSPVGRRCPKGG